MRVLVAAVISVLAFYSAAAAQEFKGPPWLSPSRCSKSDEIAADEDLDRLSDWAAVYRTFNHYKQCDDGSLAEGYSDAVVILLTKHWPTVSALSRLTRANREFGDFVLHHIDSLMSPDQGTAIVANAEKHCPPDAKAMCKRLAAKARNPL